MAKNWKRAHDKLKADHEALQRKCLQFGLVIEQRTSGERKALNDLMDESYKLTWAVTALDSAVEIFTAHDRLGTAATFRRIANDLRPRDTCAMGVNQNGEKR